MQSLTTFLLATILALAITPAPQSQKKSPPEEKKECGTVIPPEQLEAELARNAELARKNIAPTAMAPPTDAPYHLPLTIHMVRDSSGIQTGLSPEQLEKVMQNLNQMWKQVGVQFFIYGEIDDTILNDSFFNATTLEKQYALLRVNSIPNTINVYFTNLGNLTGRGTFPRENAQGILLDYLTMSDSRPFNGLEVFAHEMGHYFDLYHTHETKFGVECPSGDHCSSAGDLLCDTPADPNLNPLGFVDIDCNYTGTAAPPASCGDTPYAPSTRNLMSYGRGACVNEFTPGQIGRVLQALNNAGNRKNLINSKKRYVDRLAKASNTECTYEAPCRTVAAALQAANNGDFIFLKWGSYNASSIGGKRLTLGRWGFENGVVILP